MINKQIAKYAASMSWRFFVTLPFVMMILVAFFPLVGANPSEEASLLLLPVYFLIMYVTMYVTLLWMSYASKAKEKRNEVAS